MIQSKIHDVKLCICIKNKLPNCFTDKTKKNCIKKMWKVQSS